MDRGAWRATVHGVTESHSCLENPVDRGAWRATVHGGCKEPDATEHTCVAGLSLDLLSQQLQEPGPAICV